LRKKKFIWEISANAIDKKLVICYTTTRKYAITMGGRGGMEDNDRTAPPETQEGMITMLTRALPFLRAELGISQQQLG